MPPLAAGTGREAEGSAGGGLGLGGKAPCEPRMQMGGKAAPGGGERTPAAWAARATRAGEMHSRQAVIVTGQQRERKWSMQQSVKVRERTEEEKRTWLTKELQAVMKVRG